MENTVIEGGISLRFISSRTNDRVKMLASLKEKKYRDEYSLFLCEGEKLTDEALERGDVESVLVSEDSAGMQLGRIRKCIEKNIEPFVLSAGAFEKVSTEKSPEGVIAVCRIPNANDSFDDKYEGPVLVLDEVRDPGNVGTILRSAAAFGIREAALLSCADIYSPKTARASMGALFKVKCILISDADEFFSEMKNRGRRVVGSALAEDSVLLSKENVRQNDCIVIGNEGHGISPEVLSKCDLSLKIPISENTESLNAHVAASILLWEYSKLS